MPNVDKSIGGLVRNEWSLMARGVADLRPVRRDVRFRKVN